MRRYLLPIALLALLLASCSPRLGGSCPLSQPSDLNFTPPEPMPAEAPYGDMFWHGNAQLWTMLPRNGQWQDLPVSADGYGQKLVWWAPGYDDQEEQNPVFELKAIPLERFGEEYLFTQATNMSSGDLGSAILIGVSFPYAGCWQITGSYRGESLSYVVEIVP